MRAIKALKSGSAVLTILIFIAYAPLLVFTSLGIPTLNLEH
jgi:hypothetical protein